MSHILKHLSLQLLCLFAGPVFASQPLRDLRLTHGIARALQNPDYYLKLIESITINSGYDFRYKRGLPQDVEDILKHKGVVNLPSDEMYEPDREVRALLDPLVEKFFPGQLSRYNLVFLDCRDLGAFVEISDAKTIVPTIFIDRLILDNIQTRDGFLGVLIHEIGHVLRAKLTDEPFFDRILKRMPEESLVDGLATRILVESGYNPLGYSLALPLEHHVSHDHVKILSLLTPSSG